MKKKIISLMCAVLALVMLLPALSGCGKRLVMQGSRLTDKQNKVSYTDVSGVYMAKAVSNDVYATFKLNGVKKNFHTIEGLDPLEWLVSEYGELFYSGSDVMPGLSGFQPNNILICTNADIPMSLEEITDQQLIDRIVEAFENGESENYPDNPDAIVYAVRFSSEKYKQFYYALKLVISDDGVYLYSRYEGIYVNMGNLMNDYIPDLYGDMEEDI